MKINVFDNRQTRERWRYQSYKKVKLCWNLEQSHDNKNEIILYTVIRN